MTNATDISTVPTKENALAVFRTPKGLDPFLAKIREEIDGFIPDVTTRKGREAIASIAHKVARSKTALDNVGKELVAELKEVPKLIDAERKRVRDTLDAWKDEVRKPLDDWESAEAARVSKLQGVIDWFNLRATENADLDSIELKASIAEVELITVGDKWEEFEAEAHRSKAAALESLNAQLIKREKHEGELAEIAKFNAEKAAREQQERDAVIAREAVEKARIEAEHKATAEREAFAKREQEAAAAAERRELELKLQAEKAEREKLEATQRAEQAERDSAARAEAAAEAERQRQADARAEEERQAVLREADKKHKSKVLGQAKDAIIALNVSEELAKAIVLKIARGEVPNVTISF